MDSLHTTIYFLKVADFDVSRGIAKANKLELVLEGFFADSAILWA